jgi:hypothetical protein
MSSSSKKMSRRVLTATAGGFAAGAFAARLGVASAHEGHDHEASPAAGASPDAAGIAPLGHVTMRVRYLADESAAAEVNERVLAEFVPALEALDGFSGYLVGDLIDQPEADLTVTVLESADHLDAYEQHVVAPFVSSLGDLFDAAQGEGWSGDLLITGSPTAGDAATPASVWPLTAGYVAARVHTSLPGTDPRDFVPLAISGFLPIVSGLEGFEGYLWFPIDGGFVAVSLFDSEASALASNEAAKKWAAEFLSDYTDGNPAIYNANILYANFPVLGK